MILPDNQTNRELVAKTVASGGLVAFRTDTFYGLGADPLNSRAVQRVMDLKGQERKPILLLISDSHEIFRFLATTSKTFQLAAKTFWPGPLTIVAEALPQISPKLTARAGTIGLRLPAGDDLRALIRRCGGALTATSANPSGDTPARSAREVGDYFPAGLDVILDGGPTEASAASTVLDVSQSTPRIIREGVISRARLEEVLGGVG